MKVKTSKCMIQQSPWYGIDNINSRKKFLKSLNCDLHDFVIIAPFHFTNSNLRCDDNFVKLLFRQIYYWKQLINKCVFYHVHVSYLAHYHQEMKSGECQFCNMNMKKIVKTKLILSKNRQTILIYFHNYRYAFVNY